MVSYRLPTNNKDDIMPQKPAHHAYRNSDDNYYWYLPGNNSEQVILRPDCEVRLTGCLQHLSKDADEIIN